MAADPQASAQPTDDPLDISLDGLIGYAPRRAQLKVFQHLVSLLGGFDL